MRNQRSCPQPRSTDRVNMLSRSVFLCFYNGEEYQPPLPYLLHKGVARPISPLQYLRSRVIRCLVAQSCLTLCDPIRLLCPWGFSRQEYWSGLPCPPPGPVHRPETPVGSTHSSKRGLRPPEQLERQAEFPSSAREGAGCGSVGDVPGAWLASHNHTPKMVFNII